MAPETDPKKYLLVTGVARSGTTALGELLNSHSKICLGIERFKFQFLRDHTYERSLFERERFFDFRAEDTNLAPASRPAWKPVYDAMAEKWDSAELIGDKVPDMMPVLTDFMNANPDFKIICLLRNLKDVGLSWQARADRQRDSWPSGKGFLAACESWAEQIGTLHEMMRDKSLRRQVLLLDYDTMYNQPDHTEAALLAFLGLESEPWFRELLRDHAEFFENRRSRKVPRGFIETYKEVNQGHIRGLRKVAKEQLETWAARDETQGAN
jgi:hypothetical protein